MNIGYKTLILIDNSVSMGEANFNLVKEITKYVLENKADNDEYRIACLSSEADYLCDYTADVSELVGIIDGLETMDTEVMLTDTLTNIVLDWKEQDVALRNIVLFTDGRNDTSVCHAKEELYYLLGELNYPIYTVQCVESKLDLPNKNLSAISTISKGKLLLTEFENSEAESEKVLGNVILGEIENSRMNEQALNSVAKSDAMNEFEEESIAEQEMAEENALFIPNDTYTTNDSMIIQNHAEIEPTPIIKKTNNYNKNNYYNLIGPGIILLITIAIAVVLFVVLRRKSRCEKKADSFYDSIGRELSREADIAELADDYDCTTRPLDYECSATRLLSDGDLGHDIVLEDCNDPTKLYRASCEQHIIVGRSKSGCDVVIDNDDSVSGRHCEISIRDNRWYVRDLHSSNGTKVNQQKLFQEMLLNPGDILQLGQLSLQVRI